MGKTDPRKDAVTVAYCHTSEVAYSWHKSLIDLIGYDMANQQRVIRGGWLAMKCSALGLIDGRNNAVRQFLELDESDWFWWIDTDMGFAPDTVDQLLAAADPTERPIVGGLAFAMLQTGPDGAGGYRTVPRPTLFDWVKTGEKESFQGRASYPTNSLVQVAGTGAACVLIHRSALAAVGEKFGTWYDQIRNPSTGEVLGEDLSFCLRATAAGYPIFVHTGVRTTHFKSMWLAEADYWAQALAHPATEETAVLVPTMRRPQNAVRFMASLRASTGLATAYVIVDEDDVESAIAWADQGATVVNYPRRADGRPGSFAEKVNVGYQELLLRDVPAPWLFLAGDDVQFRPGWLDHAQAAAGERFHVIGSNDLSNPRVVSGQHATHMLIRRTYVEEVGASWDGPDVVCHEGYSHWYVDDEIVTAAQRRGVWTAALGSVVDHMHPLFGKGPDDDTYRWGLRNVEDDGRLFKVRANAQVNR
jgi:hypothetical protein